MNKILTIIVTLVLISCAYSIKCQEMKLYSLSEEQFSVEFNSNWDIFDLADVKRQLAEVDIALQIEMVEFYKEGGLKKMNATIKYPDGSAGSFKSTDLNKGEGPGFRRDLKKHPLPLRE